MTQENQLEQTTIKNNLTIQELIGGPTPKEHVKQREGSFGMVFDYVEPGYVISKLNAAFGGAWSFETELVATETLKGGHIIVKGRLTVGQTVREQFGSAQLKMTKEEPRRVVGEVGDSVKMAASDALKKCASLYGLALDVYSGGQYE